MELTLRYSGVLHSANGTNKVAEKDRVRKTLSSQLERFWEQDARLDGMYGQWKQLQIPSRASGRCVVSRPLKDGTGFWWRWPFHGHNYIPLLTHIHGASCELNIRLYRRRESDGVLYEGGDIDNRLKVFLDTLQVPYQRDQVPSGGAEGDNPDDWPPVFCLVDDDSAVTKLSITSLKLLSDIPEESRGNDNYVELDVDVTITPISPMVGTWMLGHP